MAKAGDRERKVITAQGMLDAQPTGAKAYLKLKEGLKLFVPNKGQSYKLIFLAWKAGKLNNTVEKKGDYATNRFIAVHQRVGAGDESFLCPARYGRPCAVCQHFGKLKAQGADWDKVLRHLKAKDREVWFVHDTEAKDKKNLLVWDESVHLFGNAFRATFSKREAWMAFADPEHGCVVEVEAREKKIEQSSCIDFTQGIIIEKRAKPLPEFLLAAMDRYCIDDCVVETPYEQVKKLIGMADEGDDEPEPETESDQEEEEEIREEEPEEEDEPEEDEPEEEEETEEEETEEEDPKPPKKPGRK